MKTEALILSVLLLAGCQTGATPPSSAVPARTARPPLPTPAPALRTPEIVRTYTIGAYVDPDDPALRHEAHTVQRIESVAAWDLRPAGETGAPPAHPPGETVAPDSATPPAHAGAAPPPPTAVPAELTLDPEPALMPNADGVIDLATVAAPATNEINPFTVRGAPSADARTVELRVTGILAGAKPGAIINGRLLEPGDIVEGLTLKGIEPGGVILASGHHRLRVPVSAEPTRVRTAP